LTSVAEWVFAIDARPSVLETLPSHPLLDIDRAEVLEVSFLVTLCARESHALLSAMWIIGYSLDGPTACAIQRDEILLAGCCCGDILLEELVGRTFLLTGSVAEIHVGL
jgi:hypothetical protein